MALEFLNDAYFAAKVGIGTDSPTSPLHITRTATDYSGPAIAIKGISIAGTGDVNNGFGLYLSYNLSGNRQFVFADTATSLGVRFINSHIDGFNVSTQQRADLTLGTETNGVHVAAGVSNTQFSVSNVSGTASKIVTEIKGAASQSGNYLNISSSSGTGDILTVKSSGNVGIGTVSPGVKLEVDTNSTFAGAAQFGNSTGNRLYILNDDGGNRIQLDAISSGGASNLIFSNGGSESMRIASTGNVGIGTTSPIFNLQVTGDNPNTWNVPTMAVTDSTNAFVLTLADAGSSNGIFWDSNRALRFGTAGSTVADPDATFSEKMRIDSSGNVGIGTDSPGSKFQVNVGTNQNIGFNSQSSVARISSYNDALSASSPLKINGSDLRFDISGTEKMRIDSAGNVGIGTTSPTSYYPGADNLVVKQASGEGGISIVTANDTSGAIYFADGTTGSEQYRGGIGYTHSTDKLFLVSGGQTRAWMDTNGNVGIGTDSPARKLVVSGAANGIIQSNDTAGAGSHLRMLADVTAQNVINWDKDTALRFATSDEDWGNYSERMRITSTGNVGIGTTSIGTNDKLLIKTSVDNSVAQGLVIQRSANTDEGYINYNGGGFQFRSTDGDPIVFGQVSNERMRIDPSGNVGIGMTSPSAFNQRVNAPHLVVGAGNNSAGLTLYSGVASQGSINFADGTTTSDQYTGGILYVHGSDNYMTFYTNGGGEKMRIGSDGAIKFNTYNSTNQTGTPTYLLGTDASGNIVKTTTIPGSAAGPYLPLAGGTMTGTNGVVFPDAFKLNLGGSSDLQIYHDGTHNYIDGITNDLYIRTVSPGDDVVVQAYDDLFLYTNNGADAIIARGGAAVELYHNNSKKFETTSTGVSVTGIASATTFSGDLNGTINTATTGVTQANAIDNTTIATTAYVVNKIAELPAGLIFLGTWNADTNTPTLASGGGERSEGTATTLTTDKLIDSAATFTTAPAVVVGDRVRVVTPAGPEFALVTSVDSATQLTLAADIVTATGEAYILEVSPFIPEGNYYIVSDNGATDLNGITDWKVGDWVVASSTNVWQKIDNSSVLDGSGTGQSVTKWDGSGTSNTLTDGPITFSTNYSTFAGGLISASSGGYFSIQNAAGNSTYPTYSFQDDANTGMMSSSTDSLSFVTGGTTRLLLNNLSATFAGTLQVSGNNIGVGGAASNPTYGTITQKIDMNGNADSMIIMRGSVASTEYALYAYNGDFMITQTNVNNWWTAPDFKLNSGNATFAGTIAVQGTGDSYFSGNVGIGTTSPGVKLDVNGESVRVINANPKYYLNNSVVQWHTTIATNDYRIHDGIDDRLTIKRSSGNVGIGDTTPTSKLTILGTSTAASNTPSDAIVDIHGTSTAHLLMGVANVSPYGAWINTDATGQPLVLQGVGGNVGIGTDSPVSPLVVKGTDVGATDNIAVQNSTGTKTFSVSNNGQVNIDGSQKIVTSDASIELRNNATGLMSIKSASNYGITFGDNGGETMRINTSTNNVGIGTTLPQSTLQVAGGIQMADDTDTASATKVGTMRYRTATDEPVPVTGTELVINGNFAVDANWTLGANSTISGGSLNSNSAGVYIIANTIASIVTASLYYSFRYTLTVTSGAVRLGASSGIWGDAQSTSGTYTGVQQAQAGINGKMYFTSPSSDFVGSIDDVSIIEVTLEDASYADMCMQTGASTYEWVNIVRNTY